MHFLPPMKFLPFFLIAAFSLVFLSNLFLPPSTYINPDFGLINPLHIWLPNKYVYAQNIKRLEIPLWESRAGNGYPIHAEILDIYHLPNLLIFFIYVGGKGGHNKRGRGSEHKTPVFGMVERKGIVKATVVANTKRITVMPIIREHIKIGTDVMSDEYRVYWTLHKEGYVHEVVNHAAKEYVRGNVHTNTIEGFWSQLKRSIRLYPLQI